MAKLNYAHEVDALVATYAMIGRDDRRQRGRKTLRGAIAAALGIGVAVGAWQLTPYIPLDFGSSGDGSTLEALTARVENGLGALDVGLKELRVQSDRFAAKALELEGLIASFDARIATFDERYAAIAAQQSALMAQNAELERSMAAIDRQRTQLLAGQQRTPTLERELSAIRAEREALETRRSDVADQSAQLRSELAELEKRRRALQDQRATAERERAELEALLESAGRGVSRDAITPDVGAPAAAEAPELAAEVPPVATDEPVAAPAEPVVAEADADADAFTANLFTAATVDSSQLSGMRAGYVMDNGINIAIGLTRTATVNGEAMVSNSLNFENLGDALQPGALASMTPIVVQSGPGNFLTPNLSVPSNFFGTIVQNTLDDQHISTETVYDVQIQDVGNAMRGFSAMQALGDSLMFQR